MSDVIQIPTRLNLASKVNQLIAEAHLRLRDLYALRAAVIDDELAAAFDCQLQTWEALVTRLEEFRDEVCDD